jgi:hypothetical protein
MYPARPLTLYARRFNAYTDKWRVFEFRNIKAIMAVNTINRHCSISKMMATSRGLIRGRGKNFLRHRFQGGSRDHTDSYLMNTEDSRSEKLTIRIHLVSRLERVESSSASPETCSWRNG